MGINGLTVKKVADIFGGSHLRAKLLHLAEKKHIPPLRKLSNKAIHKKGWMLEDLPLIGDKIGSFSKFSSSVAVCVFTTKGGVLKSTLSLNLARFASLHNLKSCVVGLDIQGDVTTALGHESELEQKEDLGEILDTLDQTKGLPDYFNGHKQLEEVIQGSDLSTLFLIPETPELVALNDSLNNINRREFWLKEKVVDTLKEYFDLVIMDCSPNWNKLTTNALVACDILLSPLECKINNFRNFRVFRRFLEEFKREMHLDFTPIFIPTRYSANRKLSLEIKQWYHDNLDQCARQGIRESVAGEEATALYRSIIEHIPKKRESIEMRELLGEIWEKTEHYLRNIKSTKQINISRKKNSFIQEQARW